MYQLSFHMLPIEILDMFIHQNPLVTSVSSTWSLTHLDPRAWERHKIFPNVVTDQDTKVRSEYPAETKRGGIFMVEEIISTSFHTYIYICIYVHEGCSKFFHLENVIFAKQNYFRRTFANSMFFFRGTCWPRFLRKTWMCDILKLFQASDPSSHFILRQLHLNIYVLL